MNDYDYWHHRLRIKRGEPSEWVGDDPHEKGIPQTGFWRARKRAKGPYEPIAIWYIEGAPHISRGSSAPYNLSRDMDNPKKSFMWLMFLEAVTYEDYQEALKTGLWPGDVPSVGHNSSNFSDNDELRETVADTTKEIRKWLKKNQEITNKITADEGANWRAVLLQLKKKSTDARRQEVEATKANWQQTLDDIENTANHLRGSLVKYFSSSNVSHETQPQLGGQFGRKTGTRIIWQAEIVDYDKALLHLKGHNDIIKTVEKIVLSEARKKNRTEIPGVKFTSSRAIT